MIPAELTVKCDTCRAPIGVNCLPPGPRTYHRARQMAVGTAPEQAVAKWADLFGADPDYCEGMPVDEWLDKNRGDA